MYEDDSDEIALIEERAEALMGYPHHLRRDIAYVVAAISSLTESVERVNDAIWDTKAGG